MESYDYYDAVSDDVLSYIKRKNIDLSNVKFSDYETIFKLADELIETLDADEDVTGNNPVRTGKYPLWEEDAEDNLRGNLDLLGEALTRFGYSPEVLNQGASAMDVIIRRYVLPEAVRDAVVEAAYERDHEQYEEDTLERFGREYHTARYSDGEWEKIKESAYVANWNRVHPHTAGVGIYRSPDNKIFGLTDDETFSNFLDIAHDIHGLELTPVETVAEADDEELEM